ncbi:MAG: ROK family protein [Phycisphaerae bacterium]
MAEFCIGIDLGGTFIKFGLLDDSNQRRGIFQLPTPAADGAHAVVEQMVVGVKKLLANEKIASREVTGIGIGAPGPLSISQGVIHAMPNIPGMDGCPIRDRVAAGTSLPAVLENDANAAALGEALCGAGRDVESMILLTLGTGLGSGIILNGRILHGDNEIGGEMGHLIVEPGGELCGCGQRGCLERYCSARFLAEHARRQIAKEKSDGPLAAVLAEKGRIDARDVNEARKAGDELAQRVWQRAARFLAIGCVNLCRLFDPSRIVLGGGLTRAGEDLLDPVREHFADLHWSLTARMTKIVLAEMGNDAGVIGAAAAAWQAFDPTRSAGKSSRESTTA